MARDITTEGLCPRRFTRATGPMGVAATNDPGVARRQAPVPHPNDAPDTDAFAITCKGELAGRVPVGQRMAHRKGKAFRPGGEAARPTIKRRLARQSANLIPGHHMGNQGLASVLEKPGFAPADLYTASSRPLQKAVEIQRMALSRDTWEARA